MPWNANSQTQEWTMIHFMWVQSTKSVCLNCLVGRKPKLHQRKEACYELEVFIECWVGGAALGMILSIPPYSLTHMVWEKHLSIHYSGNSNARLKLQTQEWDARFGPGAAATGQLKEAEVYVELSEWSMLWIRLRDHCRGGKIMFPLPFKRETFLERTYFSRFLAETHL